MDIALLIMGAVLTIAGIVGCIVPAVPGPPLNFIALLFLKLTENNLLTGEFLLIMLFVTLMVSVLDYIFPVFGIRIFGVSKLGTWGSIIGMITGVLFFPPFGMIIGMILGAVIGELIAGKTGSMALKAGLVSFLLNIALIVLKLSASIFMGYIFFREGISYLF